MGRGMEGGIVARGADAGPLVLLWRHECGRWIADRWHYASDTRPLYVTRVEVVAVE